MTAEKEGIRYGRQTPTKPFVLEYAETKGPEAVELYNKSDRAAMPWQNQLMYDIMAVRKDGLWTHTSFGYNLYAQKAPTFVPGQFLQKNYFLSALFTKS